MNAEATLCCRRRGGTARLDQELNWFSGWSNGPLLPKVSGFLLLRTMLDSVGTPSMHFHAPACTCTRRGRRKREDKGGERSRVVLAKF